MADRLVTISRGRCRWRLLAAACLALPAGESLAALTTLINNGPASNRVDMVFVGDGYTQAQLDAGLYVQHVLTYANSMLNPASVLSDPFGRYAKFFNVHAIDVASQQSGADQPFTGFFVNTALDATFSNVSDSRSLTISTTKANTLRNQALTGTGITADMQLAVVNESRYGGSGGTWATYAGRNSNSREIALHELAHSFSRLADEYFYTTDHYTGAEPTEPNVTKSSSGAKWAHWAGYEDPRGAELDIGVFEGGKLNATGLYRPSDTSKMRELNKPFNAVGREALILDIYNRVDPLDAWRDNSATVAGDALWVDLIDADVQAVEWYVDGALVPGASGETFDAAGYGFGPGEYSVRARAYDRVLDHVGDGGMLDLVRKILPRLEQSITWTLALAPIVPGDFNGDLLVDADDLATWSANFGLAETATASDGDADGDGDVDGGDFLVWQRNLTGGTAASFLHAVPEPATSTTGALAMACLAFSRLSRRAAPTLPFRAAATL
jgi:hypothetical protein